MHIQALTHLARELRRLAPDRNFLLFGSTSIFASHRHIADELSMYEQTVDADFVPEPVDEVTWRRLRDALGKESAFFESEGYYADINGPRAFECFPHGFRDRLVPLVDVEGVFALEPNDMAVAKVIAGPEKDITLLSILLAHGYIDSSTVEQRLWTMDMDDKLRVRTDHTLKKIIQKASAPTP